VNPRENRNNMQTFYYFAPTFLTQLLGRCKLLDNPATCRNWRKVSRWIWRLVALLYSKQQRARKTSHEAR